MSEETPDPGENTTTRLETFDVLTWDESQPYAEYREWPTYGRYAFNFELPDTQKSYLWNNSGRFSELLRLGWEPASVTIRRHGFLWLKEAKVWTFIKRVEWEREGSETSFTGSRITPGMPEPPDDPYEDW